MGTIAEEARKALRPFEAHGVEFYEQVGDQVIGDCPFSGKEKKLFVNWKNRLWDSKTAGISGNVNQFLEAVAEMNFKRLAEDPELLAPVAKDRQLPRSAFLPWGIGWDGFQYTFPIFDARGNCVDVRHWKPGTRIMSTAGCNTGLFGMQYLTDKARLKEVVYICEGEWDAIALAWLLKLLKLPGVVVGVPGAGTFKAEWVPSFKGRDVVALYDNDEAGDGGEVKCFQMIGAAAKSLRFVRWPGDVPPGFDTRDWVVFGTQKLKLPRKCWANLQRLMVYTEPRQMKRLEAAPTENADGTISVPAPSEFKPCTRSELVTEYRKWLHMATEDPLAVLYGAVLANRLEGDPLWLFLVAPPGGMKSELLMSLAKADCTLACSSLTPHALVSGASFQGGEDPSLIPRLNGKVLVVKDFTTTLVMHPMARDEIFGQLRDAYDGKFEKQFGNGVFRKYDSTFGVLAGVTPNIDSFSSLHQGLGERFLKFRMEVNGNGLDEEARIMRAMSNINREVSMRDELQNMAARFLSMPKAETLPDYPAAYQKRIANLAMLAARMRGVVNRDKYNASLLTSKTSHEIGTRLGKQFSKLAMGISMYYGEPAVSARTYRLISKIALDSVPDKIEEVVRTVYELCPSKDLAATTKDITGKTPSLTQSTIFRTLQDLQMIGIIKQIGSNLKYSWKLSDQIHEFIRISEIYKQVPRAS